MLRPRSYLFNIADAAPAGGAGAPAAPAAPQASPLADVFAPMMPTGDPAAAPPAPDAGGGTPAAPAAPVVPDPAKATDGMEGLRNHLGQFSPKAKDPEPPAVAPAKPGDPAPTPEQQDAFAAFMAKMYPETPDFLKDDAKGLTTWKQQREFMEKTLAGVREMSANELALRTELDALRAGKPAAAGEGLPETEAVKKLQMELEQERTKFKTELGEWTAEKTKRELQGLPAFKAEFQGKKATLLEEAQSVATEAKVDENTLKAIFSANSEYQLAKVLETVTDPTAAKLLGEKARAYLDVSKKETGALNAADPLAELEKWKQYEAMNQGVLGARFTDALKQQFNAAIPQVIAELTKQGGDIFFATKGGQIELQNISRRFAQGVDLKPTEVVQKLAEAAAYPIYRQLAARQAAQLAEMQKTLKQYEAGDPSRVAGGAAPAGGDPGASPLAGIFSGMLGMQAAP
jgi:hypothetical protein